MFRRVFRDSAIYAVPNAIASAMTFVLFPFYAHHFTPRQYGEFDLLLLAGMLVAWTVALQIYDGMGRFVADEQDVDKVRSYASTALLFAVGCYGVFLAAVEGFAVPLSHVVLGDGVSVSLLRIAAVWMFMTGLLSVAQAQLRWQLRPIAWATATMIGATVTIALSAVLVFGAHLGVEGAVLGQLAGPTLALGYTMVVTRGTFRLHFHIDRCREMLSFSVPMVPASMGLFLNMYADRLVVQHERSLYDVGLYGVAYRGAMITSFLFIGFQGAVTPLILAHKDEPSTPPDLARVFRVFTVISLWTFASLSLFATPALRVLAAAEYQSAAPLVALLVASLLFMNMYNFAPGLAIAKRTRTSAKLTALAGIANLALALALVPPLGITGAGLATAVSSLGWFIAMMAASQYHYPVPHRWAPLVIAFSLVAATVFVALALLPNSRASALHADTLVIRMLLVVGAGALATRIVLPRDEMRRISQAMSRFASGSRARGRTMARAT